MHKEADLQFVSARVRVTKKKIDELFVAKKQKQNQIIHCASAKHAAGIPGTRFMSNGNRVELVILQLNEIENKKTEKNTFARALHNLRRPKTSATRRNYAMG